MTFAPVPPSSQDAYPRSPVFPKGMMFSGFDRTPASVSGVGPIVPTLPQPDIGAVPPIKPHFFDRGGLGSNILRGLGEFALQYSAGQGNQAALATLHDRSEVQADERRQRILLDQEARRRTQDHDEWLSREMWKLQHPDDQFTQYITAAGIDPTSPQGQALYRQRAESMAAPPLVAVDGFDAQGNPTKTFMPRAGLGAPQPGGSSEPAPAPVGPPIGTVRNGYRFMGGNPKVQANWSPTGGAGSGQRGFR